jgi:hypothetical protein
MIEGSTHYPCHKKQRTQYAFTGYGNGDGGGVGHGTNMFVSFKGHGSTSICSDIKKRHNGPCITIYNYNGHGIERGFGQGHGSISNDRHLVTDNRWHLWCNKILPTEVIIGNYHC